MVSRKVNQAGRWLMENVAPAEIWAHDEHLSGVGEIFRLIGSRSTTRRLYPQMGTIRVSHFGTDAFEALGADTSGPRGYWFYEEEFLQWIKDIRHIIQTTPPPPPSFTYIADLHQTWEDAAVAQRIRQATSDLPSMDEILTWACHTAAGPQCTREHSVSDPKARRQLENTREYFYPYQRVAVAKPLQRSPFKELDLTDWDFAGQGQGLLPPGVPRTELWVPRKKVGGYAQIIFKDLS